LARYVEKVVGYPPLRDRRRSAARVHKALLDANAFEDLPGKWQAAASAVAG
jgi:hypothetical protein